MGRSSVAVAVLGLAAGCTHVPTLIPDPPTETRSMARATGDGVALEAVANAWREYPASVADQVTPLWVHLRNDGDSAYDITYASLQLIDEQWHLYPALPPMDVVRMIVGSRPAEPRPVLVAELDSDAPPVALAQFGFGMGLGPDSTWGSPVTGYGSSSASAAAPILGHAMREGRLLGHTQAMGFVYFQRAYAAQVLTLRIDAPSETSGAPPLVLETRFNVRP